MRNTDQEYRITILHEGSINVEEDLEAMDEGKEEDKLFATTVTI